MRYAIPGSDEELLLLVGRMTAAERQFVRDEARAAAAIFEAIAKTRNQTSTLSRDRAEARSIRDLADGLERGR